MERYIESPTDALPPGFEEMVVTRLMSIPREQSIHRTLRAIADLGRERGMTVPQLQKFFLTNQHLAEQFAIHLGGVMEARLTLPFYVLVKLPRKSIERAVRGIIEYFINHVEDGSLFDHIGIIDHSWPPDSRDDLQALLGSERFQEIVVQTFRSFVGIIVENRSVPVSDVQDKVRGEMRSPPLDGGNSLVLEEITPPFDLISGFKKNGVDSTAWAAYVDACLRGYSEQALNELFYWSEDGKPYLASAKRRERAASEAREAGASA